MFEQPRRGLDDLNRFLLLTGLIASVLTLFLRRIPAAYYVVSAVASVCLILAVLRLFSRNPQKRYQENLRYLTVVTGVRTFFRNLFRKQPKTAKPFADAGQKARPHRAQKARKNPSWNEIKNYKYLICPQCAQRLRVPRGKGRLRVTCTRCGNKFETRS